MPPLHSDGDDEEDAGGEGEVAAALHEGEDEVYEAVIRTKVKRQHKKIRKQEDNVSNAETGEESVKKVEDCSETKHDILCQCLGGGVTCYRALEDSQYSLGDQEGKGQRRAHQISTT